MANKETPEELDARITASIKAKKFADAYFGNTTGARPPIKTQTGVAITPGDIDLPKDTSAIEKELLRRKLLAKRSRDAEA